MISLRNSLSLAAVVSSLLLSPSVFAQATSPTASPLGSHALAPAPAAATAVRGQVHTEARPVVRVTQRVDDSRRTRLAGHVPQVLSRSIDLGRLAPATKSNQMVMVLKSSDAQTHELHKLLDQQQDKSTANYHQWMTPDQFGEHFGVDDADIAQVSAWLKSQGFSVDEVSKSKRVIKFSGTTGQVERAFQTEMHTFKTSGEMHVSNNSEITVPEALSPVITGVTLNNYFRKGHMGPVKTLKQARLEEQAAASRPGIESPLYTASSSTHYVGPWDFATIYNTFPLLNKGINGTGSSIAIVGRSDILLSDVQTYRTLFDLPANDPIFIHAGQDNGTQPGDDGESDLDVEISGGIAPNAQIYFVIGTPTFLVDGITNSIEYIVENNTADIMSISYGSCESAEGAGGNAFNNQAFEQAAAQGISIFVAAGDNGPAECDNPGDNYEVYGYATGGESSTPYNVSVGGSQGFEVSTYWASSSELTPPYWGLSALSYFPEVPWNEAKAADTTKTVSTSLEGLYSGSGGISSYYIQPPWQRGSGVYTADPAYTAGGSWVTAVNITNGGSGYTAGPTVTFTGGGCTAEPTGIATLSGGSVTAVTFQYFTTTGTEKTGQGFGCTSAPTIAFTAAPSGGTTATATATIGPMVNTPPLVTGVPHRYTPDLVLNAASGHDATFYCSEGACEYTLSGNTTTLVDAGLVGGTSVAAPSMAGIQALINQANGGRQGMPGYIYYALSAAQNEAACNSSTPPAAGSNCAFQDLTAGDILICGLATCTTTPQKMGWSAGTGFDLASGLGSPNAYNLATQWSSVVFNSSTTTLNLSQTASIAQGTPVTISGTVASTSGSGTPTGNVAFILSQGVIGQTLDISNDANAGAFNGPTAVATLNNGSYTATLPNLPGGSYTVTARYAGDGTFASSLSAPVPVTVNSGNSSMTITPGTLNLTGCAVVPGTAYSYGSPVYMPINVASTTGAGVPTGTVTITVDGATWATKPLDPNGNAYLIAGNYGTASNSCVYDYLFSQGPFLTGGTHTIGASYSGDGTFSAASATPVTVTVAPLTVTPTLSVGAQTITSGFSVPLVATFAVAALTSGSPTAASGPTGTVTFTDTTTNSVLATATVVPTSNYAVSPTSISTYPSYTYAATANTATTGLTTSGANSVTVSYSGDANYAPSASTPATITVDATTPVATTTTLTSSANPTTLGGRPTFTATIAAASGTAPTTGTVTFYDGTILLGTGTVGSAHTAAFRPATTYALVGGAHTITAVYGGIAANGPSTSAPFTENVTQGTVTVQLAVKASGLAGQAYTFAAVLTPLPVSTTFNPDLGPVSFYDGSTLLGTAPVVLINAAQGGYGLWTASFSTTSLAAGTHSITAKYSDVNFAVGTSSALAVKVYGSPIGNLDLAVGANSTTATFPQSDSLYVAGWAADPTDGSALASVQVLVDGVVYTPTTGGSRQDVANYFNNASYANSGFTFTLAGSSLSVGTHTVTVHAINQGGVTAYFETNTVTVTATPQPPTGNLDIVADSTTTSTTSVSQSDSIYVAGWAADYQTNAQVASIQITVDGTPMGSPILGQSRADVASAYNDPGWSNTGFYAVFSASSLSLGSHTVTMSATDHGGLTTTFPSTTINVTQ